MKSQNNKEFDVLINADNHGADVVATTFNKSWALQKLCDFTLLDFCLEWVSWFDSPNVIVASLSLDEETCEAVTERWSHLFHDKLRVITFQNCFNINDILREVSTRHLLNGDFILIDNIATFCSSNLSSQLPAFKSRLRQNKNNVLTLLYSPVESRERSVIGIQNYTNKLVVYSSKLEHKKKFEISKNLFITDTTFRFDISPCGIALCAYEFADHFSKNYDFQTFDGIIHDIITNEEFLMQNIHVEIVTDMAAFGANDYSSLLRANSLLIKRAAYPLTFDNLLPFFKDFDRLEHVVDRNVYVTAGERCPEGAKDSVFGKGFVVDSGAIVNESSFGINANIGEGTSINNSIVGDSVNIGKNCSVEECIIEDGVTINDGVKLKRNCVVGTNVIIPAGTVIENGSILQSVAPPDNLQKNHAENENNWHVMGEEINGYHVWHVTKKIGQRDSRSSSCSSIARSLGGLNHDEADELDSESADVVYQGNNTVFLSEVAESMQTILKMGANVSTGQLDKMKLEINASKLAYNVSSDDVSKNIFLAFISLSPEIRHSFKRITELFKHWNHLWQNYYKRDSSKTQFLHAIEECSKEDEQFFKIVPKFLKFLFDDEDFLSEEVVVDWYQSLPHESPLIASLKPLVEWIQQEDESSDEEE